MTYRMTLSARRDLAEITHYTIKKWGIDTAQKYTSELRKKLNEIGEGLVVKQQIDDDYPGTFMLRFRKHFIFYNTENGEIPRIIGIIHQKRDIVRLLRKRLM